MRYSLPNGNDLENIRLVPEIQVVEYDFSDLDATAHTLDIPVLPGDIILGVGHEVVTAFAGGTPALKIGIASNDDAFLALGASPLGSAGHFYFSLGGDAVATALLSQGNKFPTGGSILITHAAGLTAGAGKVHIMKYNLSGNWRQPAL